MGVLIHTFCKSTRLVRPWEASGKWGACGWYHCSHINMSPCIEVVCALNIIGHGHRGQLVKPPKSDGCTMCCKSSTNRVVLKIKTRDERGAVI